MSVSPVGRSIATVSGTGCGGTDACTGAGGRTPACGGGRASRVTEVTDPAGFGSGSSGAAGTGSAGAMPSKAVEIARTPMAPTSAMVLLFIPVDSPLLPVYPVLFFLNAPQASLQLPSP